ncbi:DUF6065 family protein [Falsiroseomonas oryziterrae]|uniref:DUF6065 family protein n=1 Tax=Falsiroseomonas oryziterrae TaxID=2911368 RepID=UPI001F37148B|nr:DUF6065 family protein [Roseomonas sp. NPKOSM-4]
MTTASPPIVTFYRMIDAAPAPVRADRSGLGSLPTRAYRHCDAVTSAAGFGWHIHPPCDFDLYWDGSQIQWTCDGLDQWLPLGAAQFPHFRARFDAAAPDAVKEYSPPFLTAIQEPGVVQVWTGLAVRTAPNWSVLLRPLANLPRHPGYEPYEGLIETDHWFGPLFTNLRLTRTDQPVRFRTGEPFLQLQPIPRMAYAEAVLNGPGMVENLEAWQDVDWDAYHRHIVAPNNDPNHQPGRYAAEARRRRRAGCPVTGTA